MAPAAAVDTGPAACQEYRAQEDQQSLAWDVKGFVEVEPWTGRPPLTIHFPGGLADDGSWSGNYVVTSVNYLPSPIRIHWGDGTVETPTTYQCAYVNDAGQSFPYQLTPLGNLTHTYTSLGTFRIDVLPDSVPIDSHVDELTHVIVGNNDLPVANAGLDQTVASGASFTLDGSGSSDPEGGPLQYFWYEQRGGTGMVISTPSQKRTTVAGVTGPRTLYFALDVTDNGGLDRTDVVKVTVKAPK